MSVIYRGKKPEKNYSIIDFYKNGVVVSWFAKFKTYEGFNHIRVIFRSNCLIGEIRTTCCHNTYAVDVIDGWGDNHCLTTECKNVREAKSILFEWFKSKGFSIKNEAVAHDWRKGYYRFNEVQLNLNPFVFK